VNTLGGAITTRICDALAEMVASAPAALRNSGGPPMLSWMKRRRSTRQDPPPSDTNTANAPQRGVTPSQYVSLFNYLDGRYADRVVLTFGQIEDLLGFSLPDSARLTADWWTNPDANTTRPRFADSWLLAKRTAQPNLVALTVVFDRAY
jgi:hypothetical protein